MRIRETVVAGQFYSADSGKCRAELSALLDTAAGRDEDRLQPSGKIIGGLVPHAGWMCSGAVAAKVFRAMADARTPSVVVLFGGVHRFRGREAAVFGDGRWETPLGSIEIDSRLADRILGQTNLIVDDPFAHESEHSLEVQIPFVVTLFPNAKIVPIMVPPTARAPEVGEAVARTIQSYKYDALIVGTTDLTHYGPNYGFTSHGVGAEGNRWAREENDRRFIELVCDMRTAQIVEEAMTRRNACSAGAVAATMAAVRGLGATRGVLLEHTTSSDVLAGGEMSDSVGYAGIVFS